MTHYSIRQLKQLEEQGKGRGYTYAVLHVADVLRKYWGLTVYPLEQEAEIVKLSDAFGLRFDERGGIVSELQQQRDALRSWLLDEYGDDAVLEPWDDERVGIAYSQYDDGEALADESWYADLTRSTLFCEINGVRISELDIVYCGADWLEFYLDFDELISRADAHVEANHELFC